MRQTGESAFAQHSAEGSAVIVRNQPSAMLASAAAWLPAISGL